MRTRTLEFKWIDELASRKENFKNAWESSLRHQLKDLPDFNTVFDYAVNFLEGMVNER